MKRTMCNISVETVIRANKRTIHQIQILPMIHKWGNHTEELDISVSVRGVLYTRSISTQQIKSSFRKAINIHAKKL